LDSHDGGDETFASWEGHSVQRTVFSTGGNIEVDVQAAVSDSATTFELDDWVLSVVAVQFEAEF
jgi:hypothetical protein